MGPSSTECIRRRAAIEVAKLTVREDGIRAVAATKHFRHRGDTLNKATLTCDLSSPLRDVVEFTAAHFLVRMSVRHGYKFHSHAVQAKPAQKHTRFERFPDFGGEPPKGHEPAVQTTHTPEKELARLSTGDLKAELCTAPDAFNVDFIGGGKKLTDIGFNSVQYGAYTLISCLPSIHTDAWPSASHGLSSLGPDP
jgi:alpha-D-xyloside xylohydrolase